MLTLFLLSAALGELLTDDLFPDKKLEAAVREMVFEKRGTDKPLTEQDVRNLSVLGAKGKQIKNLAGLDKCVALASVDLSDNEITDLGPLKDLKNLQQLMLSHNHIKVVSPLGNLVGLQYLDLNGNEIEDISALGGLVKLNTLYLSQNRVEDLGPVATLKNLWSLYLDGNKVSSLSALKDLKLLSTLGLRGNAVSELSPLGGLTELRFLFLENNKITDLGALVQMAKEDAAKEKRFVPYWKVYLSGNPLSESAKSAQLKDLRAAGGTIVLEEKR
jgi:Leucine-rich repeat (LRR) protein